LLEIPNRSSINDSSFGEKGKEVLRNFSKHFCVSEWNLSLGSYDSFVKFHPKGIAKLVTPDEFRPTALKDYSCEYVNTAYPTRSVDKEGYALMRFCRRRIQRNVRMNGQATQMHNRIVNLGHAKHLYRNNLYYNAELRRFRVGNIPALTL
jgi:hypothetical protein